MHEDHVDLLRRVKPDPNMDVGISRERDLLFSNMMSCMIAWRYKKKKKMFFFWLYKRMWQPQVVVGDDCVSLFLGLKVLITQNYTQ